MKKLAILALAIVGFASIAATCVIRNATLTDIDGDLTYGAEMLNETGAEIRNHRFKVAFISNDNQVVETFTVDGCFRSLQSDASDFFSAKSDDNDSKKVLARLEGPLTFGDVAAGDFDITNVKVTRNGKNLVVTGRIENDGPDDIEDARVCVIVYNDDDEVVVTQRDNTTFDLDNGQSANFIIDNLKVADDNNDTDHVSVGVDGINVDENDAPTDPVIDDNIAVVKCAAATNTPASTTPTNTATVTSTPTSTSTPVAATPTRTSTPDDAC